MATVPADLHSSDCTEREKRGMKSNGKGGKRHYERWPFAMRYVAFCNAKGLINRERKKFAYSAERFC